LLGIDAPVVLAPMGGAGSTTTISTSSVGSAAVRLMSTCAVGSAPCLTAVDVGYQIDEAEVIYWGRCPERVAATREQSERKRGAT
jgi:hypothetical protein